MGPKSHVDGEACFTLSFTRHCFVVVVVVVVVVVAAAIVIAELGIHIPKKWILQTLNNSNSSTDDMAHGELGVVEQLYVNSAAGQSPGNSQIILVQELQIWSRKPHPSQKEIIERSGYR